jgi:hypothetical protein
MRFLSSKVFFLMNIKKDIYFMNIYLNYLGIWLKNDAFHKKKKEDIFVKYKKCINEESRNTFSSLDVKISILFRIFILIN